MKVLIVTVDKTIGIGDTVISGVTTSMSWVPSDVYAVNWDGSAGEIEYNDGKSNATISELGIYSQAETSFNNELKIIEDEKKAKDDAFDWNADLRIRRTKKLLDSDWTQGNDTPLSNSEKTEWATYRQALRDLPANTSDPKNPTWPSEPS